MILMVDDETRGMQSYVDELTCTHGDVRFVPNVDQALRVFAESAGTIELVILDIMMPPGKSFAAKDTKFGLRTGQLVYQWIRERAPALPVIILTNVTDPEVDEAFAKEKHCWFFQKENYYPYQLAEKVERILAKRRNSQGDGPAR